MSTRTFPCDGWAPQTRLPPPHSCEILFHAFVVSNDSFTFNLFRPQLGFSNGVVRLGSYARSDWRGWDLVFEIPFAFKGHTEKCNVYVDRVCIASTLPPSLDSDMMHDELVNKLSFEVYVAECATGVVAQQHFKFHWQSQPWQYGRLSR